MPIARDVYLTATGAYLPGEPLDNEEIARRLGDAGPSASAGTGAAGTGAAESAAAGSAAAGSAAAGSAAAGSAAAGSGAAGSAAAGSAAAGTQSRTGSGGAGLRSRVLAANGIRTRHYALDEWGHTTMLNEELAAAAVHDALKDRGLALDDVSMLATGTTQGDLLVPGFASMVHGRLGGRPMELLSAGGVCASSMAALRGAAAAIRLGEHDIAVAVGSELVSRSLRQSRYAGARARFDAEFLRWTLSDGAGAVVLESAPRPDGLSLRLDWMHLVSHAHDRPVCMRAGLTDGGRPTPSTVEAGSTWLDVPDAAGAERAGMLVLRQNVAALPALFGIGLREFMELVRSGRIVPAETDHVLCHYSAEHFRAEIFALLRQADLMIDPDRWYTNLHTAGNTGAASIFVMLNEAFRAGRFAPGERILLIVPESGRFSFAFAQLTCVDGSSASIISTPSTMPPSTMPPTSTAATAPMAASPLGEPRDADDDVVRWTVLELASVWSSFSDRLAKVPLVRRIEDGTATVDDYRRLLLNLRQQVVEGGRWIARAASNFSVELFELRSAAIHHAAEEHRDFRMLERDYCAVGGSLADIQGARKNVGSEALSAYLFHQASQPDPIDLLGAMFVIEGLGTAKVRAWAEQLRAVLSLTEEQTTFLHYHGEADDEHFEMLRQVLRSGIVDRAAADRIVRTATVVARLYALQLEAIDE